ncbi:MAG: CAP domain-containing protein [Rhodobacteraceae bacterium]|nr:MAG: CAP domain-containing protein [Paracoccaceae bacterium]
MCFVAAPAGAGEEAALDPVNRFRRRQGRQALRWSPVLAAVAQAHAEDMARNGFFSHSGSDGSDVGARVSRAGYRWCAVAENIARGQRSLAAVLEGWKGSSGHRRNMLSRRMSEIGVARGPGNTWVMVLASGC